MPSGVFAGLAGVILAAQFGAGQVAEGVGWELFSIAAVVVGGTLLTGGVGSVAGTLLGVLIIALIEQIMAYWGADASRARIINGLLLFAFIALQKLLPALRVKRMRRLAA